MLNIVGSILPVVGEVIDRLVPDKAGAAKARQDIEAALVKAENDGRLGQLEINKVEAAHRSTFVAGWRPFCGWVSGFALLYHFILSPLVMFGLDIAMVDYSLPVFDIDALLTVLLGMLGLGGLRSFEKFKGVSK